MAILCCATASRLYVEETRSTLKFAARAKLIQTEAKINEVVDDGVVIKRLQGELNEARLALVALEKREKVAETSTSEAAEDLKQLKSMLFGVDELPEFASRAPPEPWHRSHASSSQKSTRSAPVVDSATSRGFSRTPDRSHAVLSNVYEVGDSESSDHADFARQLVYMTNSERAARRDSAFADVRSNRHPSSMGGRRGQRNELSQSMDYNSRSFMSQPPPGEVLVMKEGVTVAETWGHASLEYKLHDAEQRVRFLETKLDLSEDLAESLFKDIEDAKACIHQLVFKNVGFIAKIKRLKAQLHEEEREAHTLVIQQYNLLKFSMYLGLVLSLFGHHELFFAVVFFIWLSLEAYT